MRRGISTGLSRSTTRRSMALTEWCRFWWRVSAASSPSQKTFRTMIWRRPTYWCCCTRRALVEGDAGAGLEVRGSRRVAAGGCRPGDARGKLAEQFQRRVAADGHAGAVRYGRHANRRLGAILRAVVASGHRRARRFAESLGFELGSSIRTRWPARPVLVGRWGWSDPGSDACSQACRTTTPANCSGDLVLAAEQPLGAGRVFVLGGTSPLRNEMLANAYPLPAAC